MQRFEEGTPAPSLATPSLHAVFSTTTRVSTRARDRLLRARPAELDTRRRALEILKAEGERERGGEHVYALIRGFLAGGNIPPRSGCFRACLLAVYLGPPSEHGSVNPSCPALESSSLVFVFHAAGCLRKLCWSRGTARVNSSCLTNGPTRRLRMLSRAQLSPPCQAALSRSTTPCLVVLNDPNVGLPLGSCQLADFAFCNQGKMRPERFAHSFCNMMSPDKGSIW